MEEWVGKQWHHFITRRASREYPHAVVELDQVRKTLNLLLRSLSSDAGLEIRPSHALKFQGQRNWLQQIADSAGKIYPAWRETDSLNLPPSLAVLPSVALNRELYLWLTVLGSDPQAATQPLLAVQRVLHRYPAWQARYQQLVHAYLPSRPRPERLPSALAKPEQQLQRCLQTGEMPGESLPLDRLAPVPLWLVAPPASNATTTAPPPPADEPEAAPPQQQTTQNTQQRHQAERTDMPDGKSGLLAFRLESLFSWTEYLPVDRTADDEPDPDAARAAEDMDVITVARDNRHSKHKIRLDLDLPSAEYDDIPVCDGIPLPEWDYRSQQLKSDVCRLQILLPRDAQPASLPARLQKTARQLRRRFESLLPQRQWRNAQIDGSELDLDSYIQHLVDRRLGQTDIPAVYRDPSQKVRDLSCLLLADFSMSTDAWVNQQGRVVDIIQDALLLFAESLSVTRDRFALYGFSSLNRQKVRLYRLKQFAERYTDTTRGRILTMRPGYYTRMGAAIRYSTQLLERERTQQKLLLLLTDGKPNDLDIYEGRYGLEDTRMALHEARKRGIKAFCVTIDDKAEDYLPRLFGQNNWVLVRNAAELPRKLPVLYSQLT